MNIIFDIEEEPLDEFDNYCKETKQSRDVVFGNLIAAYIKENKMQNNKNFLKNDSAVSFGYIVIAAFLILGTAIRKQRYDIYGNPVDIEEL